MKKNALAILALVACALAGCTKPTSTASSDSTNPSSSSSTSTSFSGDDVTTAGAKEIQFWHCIGHEKMTNLKVIIDKFNDAHSKTDGYYVKAYQIAGEYTALHDAVKTKLSAGFVPSITMGYPDSFAEYIGTNGADKSTILNLESQIAADTTFDAAGMVPQFYTEGQDYQYTGTWSVPLYKSTEIMYYNKTMFEASAFYKAHKDETYLRSKIEANELQIPDDVVEYVAETVRGNVRDLEGIVNALLAYATLGDASINLELAKNVVGQSINIEEKSINIKDIQKAVCDYYSLEVNDIQTNSRKHEVVQARQVAMFLARKHTKKSLQYIGAQIGNRDHATVLHACKTVENLLDIDKGMQKSINYIESHLI
jgi:hypothetical protein